MEVGINCKRSIIIGHDQPRGVRHALIEQDSFKFWLPHNLDKMVFNSPTSYYQGDQTKGDRIALKCI